MQKIMTVRGVLIPDDPFHENVPVTIADAVNESALWLLLEDGNRICENGTIEVQRSIEIREAYDGINAFMAGFKKFLKQETVSSLRLWGDLIITADNYYQPILIRVKVKNSKAYWQIADIGWGKETPA